MTVVPTSATSVSPRAAAAALARVRLHDRARTRFASPALVHCCCAVLAAATVAPGFGGRCASASTAQTDAEQLAARAKTAYRDGNFELAATLFKQAYAKVAEPTLLFNAARSYQRGGKTREALTLFRLYLQLAAGGDPETAAGRAEALEHVAAMERELGEAARREQDERARVERELAALKEARRAQEATASTGRHDGSAGQGASSPGASTDDLPPMAGPGSGLASRVAPGSQAPTALTWTLLGGGAAALVTGIALHMAANAAIGDAEERLAAATRLSGGGRAVLGMTQRQVADAVDDHDSYRAAGHVLVGVGALAAGVGGWLWWRQSGPGHAARLQLAPLREGAWAGVAWAF